MKNLYDLRARDLMSHEVITVPQHMSLRDAAHVLAQAQISGAPVVDEGGRCVGVISATDFVRWTGHGGQVSAYHLEVFVPWQIVRESAEVLPNETVERFMTANPVTVGPEAPLARLAQMMLDAHIHRIIVVDQNHVPLGLVSSTDLLAALARCQPRGKQQDETPVAVSSQRESYE